MGDPTVILISTHAGSTPDMFYPQVGVATLELLEKLGVGVPVGGVPAPGRAARELLGAPHLIPIV